MEKFHYKAVLIPVFLIQLCYLSLASSDYQNPSKCFVNCGSNSDVDVDEFTFVRDSFAVGQSKTVKDRNQATNTSLLYRSARVTDSHRHPFAYQFRITENGTHFVRLHFFAFISGRTNLADAVFSVGTSTKSLLLSNFSVRNSSRNSPVIKEYLITLDASNNTKFGIFFVPREGSFAFVSAVEVFSVANLTSNEAIRVTSEGKNVTYSGLTSDVLLTVHRINAGGPTSNDTLLRSWKADDHYVVGENLARECSPSVERLDYGVFEQGNRNVAPEFVYRTCKVLDDSGSNNVSNATWRFDVRESSRHLIRGHFCDIVGRSGNTVNNFSFYIDGKFRFDVNPYLENSQSAVPFYYDFVVESGSLGSLTIGIGTQEESSEKKAYLNGVEIMEIVNEWNFEPPRLDKKKTHRLVIVGSVCSVVSVLCSVLFLAFFRWKRAKHGGAVDSPLIGRFLNSQATRKASSVSSISSCVLKLKMDLSEVLCSTHGFDAKLLVGKGGFGKVYVGTLKDGLKVAVKRSDPKHGQGLPEFQTEIMILSKIRHRHLVSLIGYCDEGSEMILVYEFMERGTLQDHLYNKGNWESSSTRVELTWSQRLEICIDAARGLHYLHTGPNGGIIHRDVKSTNILLDEHFVAKVADFGLSKSGPLDPDHFSIGIKGSFGYMDPEYLTTLQFTEKSDVYAFGVVLLEVLCGRPAIIDSQTVEEVNLAEWGMCWHKKGELRKIVDLSLVAEISPGSLRKFGEVVEKCLKRNGAERPTMLNVLWDLEYALQFQRTGMARERNEESRTDAFMDLPLVWSLPFYQITPDEGDDLALIGESSGFDQS